MTLRDRRIENEWLSLCALAQDNPSIIVSTHRALSEFTVSLQNSPAWVAGAEGPVLKTDHCVRYRFPAYYPHLPVEAWFAVPVFHPNVDPLNGFACLWRDHYPTRTVIDAIVITRALIAHQTRNSHPLHIMQPDALIIQGSLLPPSLRIANHLRNNIVSVRHARKRLFRN